MPGEPAFSARGKRSRVISEPEEQVETLVGRLRRDGWLLVIAALALAAAGLLAWILS